MIAIERLLGKASPALGEEKFEVSQFPSSLRQPCMLLRELLGMRNGFYAFASALHVFSTNVNKKQNIVEWNSPQGWRQEYGELASELFSFGEDMFGNQFCIAHGEFVQFNIETAEVESMGRSAEEWADTILSDFGYWTGFPLGWEWQNTNGPIPNGRRLFPRQPFMLGGDYEVSNLWCGDTLETLGFYGYLARNVWGISDGTPVEISLPSGKQIKGTLQR